MKRFLCSLLAFFAIAIQTVTADFLFNPSLPSHYVPLTSIPTSPTAIYSQSVWLVAIEFIPQSTTSPTCTIQDNTTPTANIAYNAIPLSPNTSYRDTRPSNAPLFMNGGITWSCTDTTVKAQLIVNY
jgi:hypothetical protein